MRPISEIFIFQEDIDTNQGSLAYTNLVMTCWVEYVERKVSLMLMEIRTFLLLLAAGFFVSSLYDLYRRYWFRKYQRSWKKHLSDIIFSMIAGVVVIAVFFYSNWGELRSYVILGLGVGIFTYFKTVKLIIRYFRS